MWSRVGRFGAFWYDFVVGDDWRVALVVVLALLVTWAVSTSGVAAWWVTPVGLVLLLPFTLWRAVASKRSG